MDPMTAAAEREQKYLTKFEELEKQIAAEKMRADVAERLLANAEARIDELMLEYCPDEMTKDQLANWAAHQKQVKLDKAGVAFGDPNIFLNRPMNNHWCHEEGWTTDDPCPGCDEKNK